MDPEGNAIVAWAGNSGEVGGYDIVRAAFRPSGGEWGEPSSLSADGGNGFPSDVVFDGGGNAAIIWQRSDGSSNVVQASYRPAAGDWEPAVDLSEEDKQGMDAVVVLDAPGGTTIADGDATAVWVSEEPQDCGGGKKHCHTDVVQAAGYDPEGLPDLTLELPAVAEAGEPVEIVVPSAAVFSPLIEFGDGGSVAETEATHTYEAPGEYEVSAAASEILGYGATASRSIKIVPAGENPRSEDPEPGGPPAGDNGSTGPGATGDGVPIES